MARATAATIPVHPARRSPLTDSGERSWHVLLIGGGAGVGKSTLAFQLARHYGVGLTEVDDFQQVLECMTTPAQYPAVHSFRQDPAGWMAMSDERKLDAIRAYCDVMAKALDPVIANHLLDGIPTIYAGDFISPAFAAREAFNGRPADGRVRAIFLYENAEQIDRNFQSREGRAQPERARISHLYSAWLRGEAHRYGQISMPARPWETSLERAVAALEHRAG